VSFINPSLDERPAPAEKWRSISFSATFPIGILYLATVLKNEGIEVSIFDQSVKGASTEETIKWVGKESPDILGFSTVTGTGQNAALIAGEVKKQNPNMTIVFGGYHATFNADRILKKYPFVDIVVRGEGETTILDLARQLEKRRNLKNVLGITFRRKGSPSIISTADRPLIENLDSLLFPDRRLLDTDYHLTIAEAHIATRKFTSIISSRGCPCRCRFCACQKMARGIWRPRSVENLVEEICLLVSQGFRQFMFVDDNFTKDPKRVIDFCRRIAKEKMDIEWIFEGRVDSSSYYMLREVVKAGGKIGLFGIESANQRILDYYHKNVTPEQAKCATKNARKAGMDFITGSFVVGAPNETKGEIENTLKFAHQLSIDIPQYNVLSAFPGTDIWNELKIQGVLNEDEYWEIGAIVSKISPKTVPYEEIEQIVQRYFRDFFLRPEYLLDQTARLLKSPYRRSVVLSNLHKAGSIGKSLRTVF
jgi:radical SAM superfamily enzyme YgiQ (UPF0313 family)